jgi:hypothetical protein
MGGWVSVTDRGGMGALTFYATGQIFKCVFENQKISKF